MSGTRTFNAIKVLKIRSRDIIVGKIRFKVKKKNAYFRRLPLNKRQNMLQTKLIFNKMLHS